MEKQRQIDDATKVLQRAKDKRMSTQVIPVEEFYTDSKDLDVDTEISRIQELPKTEENILRLENLKRIRTKRRWTGKWFENTCEELQKHSDKKRQFIMHSNPKFYWPWNPETVLVDTTFVDLFNDGSVKVKIFQGHPLLIDFAESYYEEVTGKITLNRIENWLKNPSETISFDKLM